MEQDRLATFEYLMNDLGTINSFHERDYSHLVDHLRQSSHTSMDKLISTNLHRTNENSDDNDDHYHDLRRQRRRQQQEINKSMVNTGLNFILDGYHMTGLEWAVYRNDWKTAAILVYFGGADPTYNAFDGTAKFDRALEEEVDYVFPTFEQALVVPGFKGLDLLVYHDEEQNNNGYTYERNEHARAHLWLMKALLLLNTSCSSSSSSISGEDHDVDGDDEIVSIHRKGLLVPELMARIEFVSEDIKWTCAECRDFVWNVLICMKRCGLPNELAMRVVEESLMNRLWLLLQDFGLYGTDGEW